MTNNFSTTIAEIVEWQAKTFPKATPHSVMTHFLREVAELSKNPSDEMEIADVFFMLLAVAVQNGVNLEYAVDAKLAINKAREWGKPDQDGVVEHVRENDIRQYTLFGGKQITLTSIDEKEIEDWKIRMGLTGELPS